IKTLYEDLTFEELSDAKLFEAMGRWNKKFHGLIEPIYGSVDHLMALGYSPVIAISAHSDFCNLYFVSREALPHHLKLLKEHGYSGGLVNYTHLFSPSS